MIPRFSSFNVSPVGDAIAASTITGKRMGIRGILYNGDGCVDDTEYLLLHKDGAFDGQDLFTLEGENILTMPYIHMDTKVLCQTIDEPPSAGGSYNHKFDAIVYGTLIKTPTKIHKHTLIDMEFVILQNYISFGKGKTFHHFMHGATRDFCVREY